MIIGHQRILEFLKKSIENKRLAHAYLFAGPSHLGKKTVSLEFIKMLTGQEVNQAVHPDIIFIEPEVVEKEGIKKESAISISQTREVQHQMNLFPYRASYKIAVINQAEKMTAEASNCLLKTLEEPTGKAILILITANPELLLSTIVSRCQTIKFLPVAINKIKKGLQQAGYKSQILDKIIRLSNGRPGLAIQYLENPDIIKEQEKVIFQLEKLLRAGLNERYQHVEQMAKNVPTARQDLNYWLFWFRDLLLLTVGCPDLTIYSDVSNYKGSYSLDKLKNIIQSIRKTDRFLSNPSINARLALEVLMLEF